MLSLGWLREGEGFYLLVLFLIFFFFSCGLFDLIALWILISGLCEYFVTGTLSHLLALSSLTGYGGNVYPTSAHPMSCRYRYESAYIYISSGHLEKAQTQILMD